MDPVAPTAPTPTTLVASSDAPSTTTAERAPVTSSEAQPVDAPVAAVDDGGGVPLWITLVLVVVVAALATAITAVLARRRPRPARPLPTPTPTLDAGAVEERATLVDALIEARDTMDPDVVHAQRVGLALDTVGVRGIDPVGQRFDPNLHQQVDTRVTDDPQLDGIIASVDRLGYADGASLRRFPRVVVYRARPAAEMIR